MHIPLAAFLFAIFTTSASFALEPVMDKDGREVVLPVPQKISHGGYVSMERAAIVTRKNNSPAEQLGVADFNKQVEALGGKPLSVMPVGGIMNGPKTVIFLSVAEPTNAELRALTGGRRAESYSIETRKRGAVTEFYCVGSSPRGAFYAMQTLSQLLNKEDGKLVLRAATILDYPAVEMRLIPWHVNMNSDEVAAKCIGVMREISRYKLNTLGAGRYTEWSLWSDPERGATVEKADKKCIRMVANYAAISQLADFIQYLHTVPDQLNRHSKTPRMDVTDEQLVQNMTDLFLFSLQNGAKGIGLHADDYPSWSEGEEKTFGPASPDGRVKAHAQLMNHIYNAVRAKYPDAAVLYCPLEYHGKGFGYAGAAENMEGTQQFAKLIPQDLGIIWTGPSVVSFRLTKEQLSGFEEKMSGHKPMLWDNTLYSLWRVDIGALTMFNPYAAQLPPDVEAHLFKGIHLNTTPTNEIEKVSWATFAAFAWNPRAYNATETMQWVLLQQFGPELTAHFNSFRNAYVTCAYIAAGKHERLKQKEVSEKEALALCDWLDMSLKQISEKCANKELVAQLDAKLHGREPLRDRVTEAYFNKRSITPSTYRIIGPFANDADKGFDTTYPPESALDFAASYDGQTEKVTWKIWEAKPASAPTPPPSRDPKTPPPAPRSIVNYTYCRVVSPDERRVEAMVKTFSAFKMFVNGKEVFQSKEHSKTLTEMQSRRFQIPLQKGRNDVLIKIATLGEPTAMSFRIQDEPKESLKITDGTEMPQENDAPQTPLSP